MRYIDFDGVIMDTDDLLFNDWRKYPERYNLPWDNIVRYIQRKDWEEILNKSEIINDGINTLKNMDINTTAILAKVYSLENEGVAKINYLRNCGIKQDVILVPYNLEKTDIVKAQGNILVDDSLKNLSDWEMQGGYPMFFDKNENNIDSFGKYNHKKYQRVLRIDSKRDK